MYNFRELKVWQKSILLVIQVYEITKPFPAEEKFNLTSQMQRCATSIASNIAEGTGRNTNKAFKQFLTMAIGSAHELETQLIISNHLKYLGEESFNKVLSDVTEVQKMLYGLHNSLQDC